MRVNFPFGFTTEIAISLMLAHAVTLEKQEPGCWKLQHREILCRPWGLAIARAIQYVGGETDSGQRFFSPEAAACEILCSEMPNVYFPPGRN